LLISCVLIFKLLISQPELPASVDHANILILANIY